MKNILFSMVVLTGIIVNAQTTIVDEKFEKDNFPLGYNFLQNNNKIVIQKGKHIGISTNRMINNLYSYDSNGKKETLLENVEVMNCSFSNAGSSFSVVDYAKMSYSGKTYKVYTDGKSSPSISTDDWYQRSNDQYELSIVNQKGNKKVDFEKDQLYLSIVDILTRKGSKIQLEKPDLARLRTENAVKYFQDLTFSIKMNENNFELITKFISKDYKSSILYRTVYNFEGKKIEDLAYKTEIQDGFLIYCSNGGGTVRYGTAAGSNAFLDDLSIDNFMVDKKTEDVYVYGIFGDHARKSREIGNDPLGYYIFKYDKKGNKIWESINPISDKKDYNDSQTTTTILASLIIRNNELVFSTAPVAERNKEYLHYAILDKASGNVTKGKKITYKSDNIHTMMSGTRLFLLSFCSNKEELKNKVFDNNGLIALDTNQEYANYISSIKSKSKLFFNTFFSKEGIWLLESDNESYYKTTYFKLI
ncbi:hypothetical protein [Flavobacterium sp. GT3R68]|uniref:hypothetical protein n=1 Tax=Flavobacterium sp. GT3R68 TaxID=2594437 RepID=UPI000F866E9A|nr:hypothetical protein [Flavobacterium sp. GT3R68]RTY95882.1 hypothetical protein EKL32_04345 [Flavobacterium sp. GSN2]TRW93654.1 hypothetical protein FNW07_01735 [Flavobacterium sp. GT3R68]